MLIKSEFKPLTKTYSKPIFMYLRVFVFLVLVFNGLGLLAQKKYCEGYITPGEKKIAEIHLDRIIFMQDRVAVFMHYTSIETGMGVRVEPPWSGTPVILKTHDKVYKLIGAKDIEYTPNFTEVENGATHHFQLYFQPMPNDVTNFDIIETGIYPNNSFNFYGVKITRCHDQQTSIRFVQKMDFDNYFVDNNAKEDAYEGYWLVSKKIAEMQKNDQFKFIGGGGVDTVAVVKEDGKYRAYFLDGVAYGAEFKEQKGKLWAYQSFWDEELKLKAIHQKNVISYRKEFSKKWIKNIAVREWQDKKIMFLASWRKVY